MEYNKNIFSKVNDHKVLHKVKKQWVVMSMAMLALLGGGAIAHKVSAHADVANHINNNDTLRERLNQSLVQIHNHQGQTVQNQKSTVNNSQQSANKSQMNNSNNNQQTGNNIVKQADVLHQRILRNADLRSSTLQNSNSNKNINVLNQNSYNIKQQINPTVVGETHGTYGPYLNKSDVPHDVSHVKKTGVWDYKSRDSGEGTPAQYTLYSDGLLYIHDGYFGDDNCDNGAISTVVTGIGGADQEGSANPDNYPKSSDYIVRDDRSSSDQGPITSDLTIKSVVFNNVEMSQDPFNMFSHLPNMTYINFQGLKINPGTMYNGGFFRDDNDLQDIDIFSDTNFNNFVLDGNWVNSDNQPVNFRNGTTHPAGRYYDTDHCVWTTVNYIYGDSVYKSATGWIHGGNIYHSKIGWIPRSSIAVSFPVPSGFEIDPTWEAAHPTIKPQTDVPINIPIDKIANVNYYFGSHKVSSQPGHVYFSKDGTQQVSAYNLEDIPNGYAVDPRLKHMGITINSNGDNNIQVDKCGSWGNTNWYLTSSDANANGADVPNNNLYLEGKYRTNGRLDNPNAESSSGPFGLDNTSITNDAEGVNDESDIHSISFSQDYPVTAPTDSRSLFWGAHLDNLSDINVVNLNTNNVNNMAYMFHANDNHSLKHIDHLSDLKTSDVNNMQGMFLNSGISDVKGVSDWDVNRVTNLNSDFQGVSNLHDWSPIQDHWFFDRQPTDNNMLLNTGVSNQNTPPTYQHANLGNKWAFFSNNAQINLHYEFNSGTDKNNVSTISDTQKSDLNDVKSKVGSIQNGYYIDPNNPLTTTAATVTLNLLPNYIWSGYKWGQANVYFDGQNDTAYVAGGGTVGKNDGNGDQSFFNDVYKNTNEGIASDTNSVSQLISKLPNNKFDWKINVLNATILGNNSFLFQSNNSNVSKQFSSIASLSGLHNDGTNIDSMLSGNSDLKSINMEGFDASKVTDMKSLFADDAALNNVDLKNLNADQVTRIGHLFENDPALKDVNLAGFKTGHLNNVAAMFNQDTSLESINLSGLDTSGVTSYDYGMSNMFSAMPNLKRIKISSDTLLNRPGSNPTGWGPFFNNSSLVDDQGNQVNVNNLINGNFSGLNSVGIDDQGHKEYEIYLRNVPEVYYSPNNDQGYSTPFDAGKKANGGIVIDPSGHQKINGMAPDGSTDDEFKGYSGQLNSLSPVTPNGYSDAPGQTWQVDSQDHLVDKLNGHHEVGNSDVYFYTKNSANLMSHKGNVSGYVGKSGTVTSLPAGYQAKNPSDLHPVIHSELAGTNQNMLKSATSDDGHLHRPIYVQVVPQPKVTYQAPVTIKYINGDGSAQYDRKGHPKVQSDDVTLTGSITGIVSPMNLPTESGYSLANNVNDQTFTATMGSNNYTWNKPVNGKQALDPSAANVSNAQSYNWDSANNRPLLIFKANNAGNIILNYINQSGQSVGPKSDVISGTGRYGDSLNILNPSNRQPDSTYGYPNPDSDDYRIDTSKQLTRDYTFNSHDQYVTVPLIGNNSNNTVTIHLQTANSDGSGVKYNKTIPYHPIAHIGSDISVRPSDYLHDLNVSNPTQSYVVDPNTSAELFYLKGNHSDQNGSATLYNVDQFGHPTTKVEPGANVYFTYDASPSYNSDAQPIDVKYIDQHNNQISGEMNGKTVKSDIITPTPSDYGHQINVASSDSKLTPKSGQSAQGMNVPSGYHLAPGQNTNYRIMNHQQNVVLNVYGNRVHYALPIKIHATVYKSDGKTVDATVNSKDQLSDGNGHQQSFTNGVANGQLISDGHGNLTGFAGSNASGQTVPQLVGVVGHSDDLNSADYQPQIDSDHQTIISSGSNYHVHFGPQGLTVYDSQGHEIEEPSVASLNGITFNYQILDKPATQQRNYIHYISYSDVDNRGDITTQPHHQAFPTKVSDASDSGSTFSDKYYRENVPKGYQFYKVYSVNGNTNDSQISGGLKHFGDGNGNPGEEYIEVIPNASPITFHYINQNGSDVKDVQLSGNGSDKSIDGESEYTSNFGTKITSDQINKSDQPTSQLGVPQGYQYNALKDSQGKSTTIGETQPVFSRDPQDVYIPVTGKTYNKVNVQLQQDLSDANHAKHASDYTYTINNAQVGRNYTIYGFNLNLPSTGNQNGYVLNQQGHPFKVTVHINPDNSYSFLDPSNSSDGRAEASSNQGSVGNTISVNNVSDIKDNKIFFNSDTGDPTATNPPTPRASFWYHVIDRVSQPLILNYINQAGQRVGCPDKIQGTIGQTVNVTNPNAGGMSIPSDYELDGGTNQGSDGHTNVLGNNQDTQYVLTDHQRSVFLHVKGKTIGTSVAVYSVVRHSDGTVSVSHRMQPVSGSDGSAVELNPVNYKPTGNYAIDYSKAGNQMIQLSKVNNQVVASPNRVAFYYYSNQTNAAPLTMRYIDEATGQLVGYTRILNGNLNDKVAVAESKPTGSEHSDLAGEDVPIGYYIDTTKLPAGNLSTDLNHPVYQFSNSSQILNLQVLGTPKTLTYHIHVFKEDSDGTIQGPASDVKLKIHGRIGQTFHISPYGFGTGGLIQSISDSSHNNQFQPANEGSGYHATNLDLDKDVQINENGQLSPDDNTNYFYQENYQPQQIGTVRIHYITDSSDSLKSTGVDQNGVPNDKSEVDEVSDKGTIGNGYTPAGVFDLSPYRDDIPETLQSNYQSANVAMTADGTKISDDDNLNDGGNKWNYSENNNGFTNGIRDVYIQVKKRGTDGDNSGNGPIIIDSDGQFSN